MSTRTTSKPFYAIQAHLTADAFHRSERDGEFGEILRKIQLAAEKGCYRVVIKGKLAKEIKEELERWEFLVMKNYDPLEPKNKEKDFSYTITW